MFIAAVIGMLMLIPLYDDISSIYFPTVEGMNYGSDVTGGIIVMVFAGIYGMTALAILGIITGLRLSELIRSGLNAGVSGDTVEGRAVD